MQECECCIESFIEKDIFKCMCNYVVCKNCLYKYLESIVEVKCMNCNLYLDEDIIENIFTITKYTIIKRKKVDTIFEMERSLLGETQEILSKVEEKKITLANLKKEFSKYSPMLNDCFAIEELSDRLDRLDKIELSRKNSIIAEQNRQIKILNKTNTVQIKTTSHCVINNISRSSEPEKFRVLIDYIVEIIFGLRYKTERLNYENLLNIHTEVVKIREKYPNMNKMKYYQMQEDKNKLAADIERLEQGKDVDEILPEIKEETKSYKYNCTKTNCIGVLNQKYVCNLCKTKHCRKCKEIKTSSIQGQGDAEDIVNPEDSEGIKLREDSEDEETPETTENKNKHVCDPNILESVKLINSETKPCPNCKVPIFKISGCYQMWCTNCKLVAFDWGTGKVLITKNIHNPHLIEYQNSTENKAAVRGNLNLKSSTEDLFYMEIRRLVPQVNDILDRMERITPNLNWGLRVRYIQNDITEKRFKTEIMRRNTFMYRTSKLMGLYQQLAFKANNFISKIDREELRCSEITDAQLRATEFVTMFYREREIIIKQIHDSNVEIMTYHTKYDRNVNTVKCYDNTIIFSIYTSKSLFLV